MMSSSFRRRMTWQQSLCLAPVINLAPIQIGSGKLSETFRYSEVGDTYIFPCNVIHRTVLETPLSCALSQAPENEKTIKLFKDFLERKSQFREHGAIVKVAFFYKKKSLNGNRTHVARIKT